MSLPGDVFNTFVIFLGSVYAVGGWIGGMFLGRGMPGAFASAAAFGTGGAAAGILVWILTMTAGVPSGLTAAVFYPPLAGGIGGWLLGRFLERENEKGKENGI